MDDGSMTECRRSQRVHAHGRGCRQMPHSNDLKNECVSLHSPISETVGKQYLRPQGNRVAKRSTKIRR
jgi:hypothetical protein